MIRIQVKRERPLEVRKERPSEPVGPELSPLLHRLSVGDQVSELSKTSLTTVTTSLLRTLYAMI